MSNFLCEQNFCQSYLEFRIKYFREEEKMTNPNGLDPETKRELYDIQRQAYSDALRENRRREAIGDAVGKLTKIFFLPICMIGMGMYLNYCGYCP